MQLRKTKKTTIVRFSNLFIKISLIYRKTRFVEPYWQWYRLMTKTAGAQRRGEVWHFNWKWLKCSFEIGKEHGQITVVKCHSIFCKLRANSPGVEFLRVIFKFRKRKKTKLILYYCSFKIFLRFWLAESTRIIHHNQLLLAKFGSALRLINPPRLISWRLPHLDF